MTMLTAPSSVTEGLYLLAHILATADIPGPYHIGDSILADNDAEGTAEIDRIGLELEKAGITHHVKDTDHHREVVIPLADRLEYRIVYVFRAAMEDAKRRDSYRDNIA